jgi:hypothetical protein
MALSPPCNDAIVTYFNLVLSSDVSMHFQRSPIFHEPRSAVAMGGTR